MAVLIITPDMSAEMWLGAAGCARGSHMCSGTTPALAAKPTKASKNIRLRTPAESGKEGVDFLRTERPDLILFDFWMPEMRGDEFVAEVWKVCKRPPPLVACSADPDFMDWDARSSGVRHAISKPFDVASLVGTVKKALAEA